MPDPDDHASLLFDPVEAEPEDHPALQTLMPGRPGAEPRIGLPAGPLSLTGEDNTPAFRPQHRPPMAVLCILHVTRKQLPLPVSLSIVMLPCSFCTY